MKQNSRRERIYGLLLTRKRVRVNELCWECRASEATIRRDLQEMEQNGLLRRVHGGAELLKTALLDGDARELSLREKLLLNLEAKRQIGMAAAELVEDNDRIFLEAGSTVIQMVPYLWGKRDLVVVTNCLAVADEIAKNSNIRMILVGGEYRSTSMAMAGLVAESCLQQIFSQIYVDKLFMGADGVTLDEGVTTPSLDESRLGLVLIKMVKKKILLVDSTKFGRVDLCRFAPAEAFDMIVTDDGVRPDLEKGLKKKGIKLIVAPKPPE